MTAQLSGVERREALYRELLPQLRSPSGDPHREKSYPTGDGRIWSFCPAHPDGTKHHNRSLSLSTKYGVECFAGCEFTAIIDGFNLPHQRPTETERVVPIRQTRRAAPQSIGEPRHLYVYCDSSGVIVAEKGRWEQDGNKTFRWRKPGGTWQAGIAPLKVSDMPLWGADLVASAPVEQTVYLVEGEKSVEACRARGLLTVTCAGGASTTDFGAALEVLRGRDVRLWPDNDAVGREFMLRAQAQLRGVARHTTLVAVDVPEKGDAFDYFSSGGTLEQLEQGALSRPVREFLAHDVIRVRLPSVAGVVVVTCSELEKTTRALETEVRIDVLGPPEREPTSARVNIQSLSQTAEFRRTLDTLYGKDFNWAALLNQTFTLVRDGYLEHDPSVDTAEIEFSPTQAFHVAPLLPYGAPSIVFADGSAGKSYFLFAMMAHAALGLPFCGMDTQPGRWMVLDYETGKDNYARRMHRIARGLGLERMPPELVQYWPARGIPLHDSVEAIARKIRKENIVGLMIDSAAAACGGEPEKAEIALRYFNALAKLGITTVTVAHINRGGDTERPFGSTFWHNEARRTWYIERVSREESDLVDLGLFCRKVNDGRKPRPFGVAMTFEGDNGPVRFATSDLRDVPELNERRDLDDRIWDALPQPRPIHEIVETVGANADAIKKQLGRRADRFVRLETGSGRGHPTVWARRA
jgi:hypothetical protein